MKKVMFHLHCLGKGGAERVVVNLAEEFVRHQYQVVITVAEEMDCEYAIEKGITKRLAGPGPTKKEKEGRIGRFVQKINCLRKVILEEKPDIIIAFGKSANYRAMMATVNHKIPVIVSVRNDPAKDYSGAAKGILNKLFLERAGGCVFQTEEARSFFSEKLQAKSKIILNPIHEKYLSVQRKQGMREKRIVTVGRFAKQKNQLLLLQAFAEISAAFPDYVLELYGGKTQDDTEEKLRQYVREHKLEERIIFMGIRDDLERQLPDAALFVLPSDYEGMPNVLMEAMAMGLPVIATDCPCGGPRTLIESGQNGLLVPVGEVGAMAKAMEILLTDTAKAEQMGRRAADIGKVANSETVYQEWEELIQQVLSAC